MVLSHPTRLGGWTLIPRSTHIESRVYIHSICKESGGFLTYTMYICTIIGNLRFPMIVRITTITTKKCGAFLSSNSSNEKVLQNFINVFRHQRLLDDPLLPKVICIYIYRLFQLL